MPPFIARVTLPLHHVARRTTSVDLVNSICCLLQPRVAKDQCRPPPLLLTSSASPGSRQVRHHRPLLGNELDPVLCFARSNLLLPLLLTSSRSPLVPVAFTASLTCVRVGTRTNTD